MVNNESGDFKVKVNKTISMVKSVLGLPTDIGVFKKFLVGGQIDPVHSNVKFPSDISLEKMSILETFLTPSKLDVETGNIEA